MPSPQTKNERSVRGGLDNTEKQYIAETSSLRSGHRKHTAFTLPTTAMPSPPTEREEKLLVTVHAGKDEVAMGTVETLLAVLGIQNSI